MSDTPPLDQYQTQDHEEFQGDFGGRRKKHLRHTEKHRKSQKNMIVVGKVYADWCGHCQSLKPEWAKMKNKIHKKKGKHYIIYEEVEEKEIDTKLNRIKNEQKVNIEANGYPTLFRISNGKVDYYRGNRQSDAMADWYLRGGDSNAVDSAPLLDGFPNILPNLMQDQQGGRHIIKKRHRFERSRHHGKHHNKGTRKHTEKRSTGMFDFLFGK
jgi:thiol-disulfide isomerase/thioredoxin